MKHSLLTTLLTFSCAIVVAQSQKVIVNSVQYRDYKKTYKKQDCLATVFDFHTITFVYDSVKHSYLTESVYLNQFMTYSNLDTVLKRKHKSIKKRRRKPVPAAHMDSLIVLLTNTKPKDTFIYLHTSHYSLHVHVLLISGEDTAVYSKGQPFDRDTYWRNKDSREVVRDQRIDRMIYQLMPAYFNGRETLLSAYVKA